MATGMTGAPLDLYNSFTRRVDRFAPIDAADIRVYSCGPTVYNYAHIGNLRAYVFTDTLSRVLTWKAGDMGRSEEHTSELQSLMRISYAVFCLQKQKNHKLHINF